MTSLKRWMKRILIGVLVLVATAIVVGAGYEARMRRQAVIDYPAPGRLVDVGGRRIQLDCRSSGSPLVVLEAGGEQPPYVMVGHSLGGPYIMTFSKLHPTDVAGLVFVDASHPEQFQRFNDALGRKVEVPAGLMRAMRAGAALAWTGIIRVGLLLAGPASTDPVVRTVLAYTPTSLGPLLEEVDAIPATMAEAGSFRLLGDRPLVVLTAMAPPDTAMLKQMKMTREENLKYRAAWRALHDEEASWSTQSEHILVPDASHYIQDDRPDIVIAAVRKVVGLVRSPVAVPPGTPR